MTGAPIRGSINLSVSSTHEGVILRAGVLAGIALKATQARRLANDLRRAADELDGGEVSGATPAQCQFQIGDRVRVVSDPFYTLDGAKYPTDLMVGDEVVVMATLDPEGDYEVRRDRIGRRFAVAAGCLELVSE